MRPHIPLLPREETLLREGEPRVFYRCDDGPVFMLRLPDTAIGQGELCTREDDAARIITSMFVFDLVYQDSALVGWRIASVLPPRAAGVNYVLCARPSIKAVPVDSLKADKFGLRNLTTAHLRALERPALVAVQSDFACFELEGRASLVTILEGANL